MQVHKAQLRNEQYEIATGMQLTQRFSATPLCTSRSSCIVQDTEFNAVGVQDTVCKQYSQTPVDRLCALQVSGSYLDAKTF